MGEWNLEGGGGGGIEDRGLNLFGGKGGGGGITVERLDCIDGDLE